MRKGLIFGLYFRDENKMLHLVWINRLGSCPECWGIFLSWSFRRWRVRLELYENNLFALNRGRDRWRQQAWHPSLSPLLLSTSCPALLQSFPLQDAPCFLCSPHYITGASFRATALVLFNDRYIMNTNPSWLHVLHLQIHRKNGIN